MDIKNLIPKAIGFNYVKNLRRPETKDIVKRLNVIPPEGLIIEGFPNSNPHTVFNPSMLKNGEVIEIFGRIIMGYYKYVSAIVSIKVPIDTIVSGGLEQQRFRAKTILLPSTKYDFWGVEDPRTYKLEGKDFLTYTGRTKAYFIGEEPPRGILRDVPITAYKDNNNEWKKLFIHIPPDQIKDYVESDKNSFIVYEDGSWHFFHRPSLRTEDKLLLMSKLPENPIESSDGLRELSAVDPVEVIGKERHEEKIGWGPPPLRLKNKDYLFLLHGVDNDLPVYRVFAIMLELDEEVSIKAVTPTYIMEPKEKYEVFGDRPYTIYPCGLVKASKNELLISYGAGDYAMAFALIDIDELLGELDKGRIF